MSEELQGHDPGCAGSICDCTAEIAITRSTRPAMKSDPAITRWTPTGNGAEMEIAHGGYWMHADDVRETMSVLRERLRIAEDKLSANGTMIEGDYAHLIMMESDIEILRAAILKHAGLYGLSEVLRVALSKVNPNKEEF